MNPARGWPIAIVGVLAVTVAGNVGLYLAANDRDAAIAEPDYYRRAVAWDSTLAEGRRSLALGWHVETRLVSAEDDSAALEIDATDRDGVPISGARAVVTALHSRPPMRQVEARATLGPDGTVAVPLPLARTGLWEFRLRLRRGTETFVRDFRDDRAAVAR